MTVLLVTLVFSQNSDTVRVYGASKGDTVRYDSAAVIQIDLYRLIRNQVSVGTAFVDTLENFIHIQQLQQARQEKIVLNLQKDISLSDKILISKDSIISSQSRVIEKYYSELNKPKPVKLFPKIGLWFKNNWEGLVFGLGAGAYITSR